jgi:hypothetical protein
MKHTVKRWRRCLTQAAIMIACSGILLLTATDTALAAPKKPRGGGLDRVPPLTPTFNKHARPPTNGGGGKPSAAPKPKGWDPPPPKRGF